MYSQADLTYIRAQFVPLDELCATTGNDLSDVRAAIRERRMPAPPYPDIERVPANYFDLPDAAEFRRTYVGDDVEDNLEAYLDGTYFVCVRDATTANIARKNELVDEIRSLLNQPQADSQTWLSMLHTCVDELDEIELPFSPDFDRARFGRPLTRDELIEGARRLYPRDSARRLAS